MAERLAAELLDASNGIGAADQAQGRPAEDGGVQQGFRALPLVSCHGSDQSARVAGRRPRRRARAAGRHRGSRRCPRTPGCVSQASEQPAAGHVTTGTAGPTRTPSTVTAVDRDETSRARHEHDGHARFPSRRPATSGSWPTSTRARPPRPSGSSTTPAAPTRSARCTRAPRSWTGWSRSRSAASPSRRPPPPASGATTGSTSSTRPATSTSPSRSSGRCASSTARSRCSTRSPASSPRPRPCGARPTSTTCRACASSTRWTASAPTSSAAST